MSDTTAPQTVNFVAATQPKDKSLKVAYVLWFFFGFLGVHHFYLGKTGRGLAYLLTFAFLTLGAWVDLFTLPAQTRNVNLQRRAGLL